MASNLTVDTLTKGSTTLNTDEIVDTNSNQICKAWVNFAGSGTVFIRDSHNVSSITDNGTGTYGVNFTNNMANANYAVGGSNNDWNVSQSSDSYATSSYLIRTANISSYGLNDIGLVTSMVFGD